MAKPSLSEKEKFFASVLADRDFRNEGVLFGEDPALARNCKWVVVDPDRHVLSVWQKPLPTQDFVSAALQLDASVFTNGPFFNYHDFKIEAGHLQLTGRNPAISYAQYLGQGYLREHGTQVLDSLPPNTNLLNLIQPRDVQEVAMLGKTVLVATGKTGLNLLTDAWKAVTRVKSEITGDPPPRVTLPRLESARVKESWSQTGKELLAATPCGYVIGTKGSIMWNTSAKHLAHFGRKAGTDFASYQVGDGDPTGLSEAIGALIRAINEYKVLPDESAINCNQYFYWGLAPLQPDAAHFKNSGLGDALTQYAKAGNRPNAPAGLIFGLFYQAASQATLMVQIGVKDAVRLDGSDSVIFGHHKTLLWGDSMFQYKRISQGWGFAFHRR